MCHYLFFALLIFMWECRDASGKFTDAEAKALRHYTGFWEEDTDSEPERTGPYSETREEFTFNFSFVRNRLPHYWALAFDPRDETLKDADPMNPEARHQFNVAIKNRKINKEGHGDGRTNTATENQNMNAFYLSNRIYLKLVVEAEEIATSTTKIDGIQVSEDKKAVGVAKMESILSVDVNGRDGRLELVFICKRTFRIVLMPIRGKPDRLAVTISESVDGQTAWKENRLYRKNDKNHEPKSDHLEMPEDPLEKPPAPDAPSTAPNGIDRVVFEVIKAEEFDPKTRSKKVAHTGKSASSRRQTHSRRRGDAAPAGGDTAKTAHETAANTGANAQERRRSKRGGQPGGSTRRRTRTGSRRS